MAAKPPRVSCKRSGADMVDPAFHRGIQLAERNAPAFGADGQYRADVPLPDVPLHVPTKETTVEMCAAAI